MNTHFDLCPFILKYTLVHVAAYACFSSTKLYTELKILMGKLKYSNTQNQ